MSEDKPDDMVQLPDESPDNSTENGDDVIGESIEGKSDDRDESERLLSDLLDDDSDNVTDNLTSMLEGVPSTSTDVFTGMQSDTSEQSAIFKSNITDEEREEVKKVLAIKVPFKVILAEKDQSVNETINLQVGSLIEFEKNSDEQLDVFINNQILGTGEVVKINERFGIRIKNIISLEEKIRKLGV